MVSVLLVKRSAKCYVAAKLFLQSYDAISLNNCCGQRQLLTEQHHRFLFSSLILLIYSAAF